MNIERIEVNNIVSLSDTIIDFTREPLKSAGLCFLTNHKNINGNMLLTMICLSLYNEAPDINDNISSVLKKEDKSGLCKVTFIANDGNRYEASYKIRHTIIERALTQLTPKSHKFDIQTIQQAINQLVGLNYHQFIHTIILQQDKFLNFLKSDQQTRLEILENISDLDIYSSIQKNIYEEYLNAKNAYTAKCQHIDDLTKFTIEENEFKELNITLSKKQDLMKKNQTELDYIRQMLEWYDKYYKAKSLLEQRKQQLFVIQKDINSLYNDRVKLNRFDKILPMKELFYSIKKYESNIAFIKNQLAAKSAQLIEQKQKEQDASNVYNAMLAKMEESNRNLSHFRPLIKKGYLIEKSLLLNDEQIHDEEKQLEKLNGTLQQTQEKLQIIEANRDKVEKQQQETSLNIQQLAPNKVMFDHFDNVFVNISKLNDTYNILAKNNNTIQELEIEISNLQNLSIQQKNILDDLNSKIGINTSKTITHKNAIKGINNEEVQEKWMRCNMTISKAESALELWQQITNLNIAINDVNEKIQLSHNKEILLEKEILTLQQERTKREKIYENLNLSLQLSKVNDINKLREDLQEGMPCAVCGGTHHPYHPDSVSQFNDIMKNLTNNVNEAKNRYEASNAQYQEIRNEQEQLQMAIKVYENQLADLVQKKKQAVESWKKYEDLDSSFNTCDEMVNAFSRQTLLTQILENAYRDKHEQEIHRKTFNEHQNAITKLCEQLVELNININEHSKKYYYISQDLKVMNSQKNNLIKENEKAQKVVETLTSNLEPFITLSNWSNEIKNNYDTFSHKLHEIYSNWNSLETQQNKNKQDLLRFDELISTIHYQLDLIQQWQQQITEHIRQLKQEKERHQNSLISMFGNSSTQETEDKIQSEYTQAFSDKEKAYKEYQTTIDNTTLLNGEIGNLNNLLKKSQDSLREQHEALDHEISIFNGDNSTLQYFELDQLFSDPQDWNILRETLNKKDLELYECNNMVEKANQEIIALINSSNKPIELGIDNINQLRDKYSELKEQQQTICEELEKIQSIISSNNSLLEKIHILSTECDILETEYKNWEQLYSVIGNPNDKTFFKIAHGKMFELLVASANKQLQNISTRYRLRCNTDNFTLEVIDKEMFDQTKSMTSLSTNESFIVSLSLSLGLSSLNAPNLDNLFVTSDFSYYNDREIDFALNTYNKLQYANKCKVIFLKFP